MGPGVNHAPEEPISQVGFNHSTRGKVFGNGILEIIGYVWF